MPLYAYFIERIHSPHNDDIGFTVDTASLVSTLDPPWAIRSQLEQASGRLPFLVIFAIKEDESVEIVMITFSDERAKVMGMSSS